MVTAMESEYHYVRSVKVYITLSVSVNGTVIVNFITYFCFVYIRD